MQNDELKRRVMIYPAYINRDLKCSEGRRIPESKGCEDPGIGEILDCCKIGLKLPADYEIKSYPRQWWVKGRVRVSLKDKEGKLINPAIPDRKTLYLKVAELIPKHPGRSLKAKAAAAAAVAAAAAAQAKALAPPPAASSSGGKQTAPSGKKKKGKK